MSACEITLNGKKVKVAPGQTILESVRAHGIRIPSLCQHEALKPYGACRLCIVEVEESSHKQIVTSCNTYAGSGMKIRTHTAAIQKIRKTLIALLLARSPNVPFVRQLARDLGIKNTPFRQRDELCIMCGLCVRTCREIVGANALNFAYKGSKREVAVPFFRDSGECIGCGACVYVCPTGAVKMHDEVLDSAGSADRVMDNWETRIQLQNCKADGKPFAAKRMLEHFAQRYEVAEDFIDTCSDCRHKD